MKYLLLVSVSFVFLSLFRCCPKVDESFFVGNWTNEKEDCEIYLNKDFSFWSRNLPLDIESKYFLSFDKNLTRWEGRWSLVGEKIKLSMNDSYYFIDIRKGFMGERRMFIKLTEESGGAIVYLSKN